MSIRQDIAKKGSITLFGGVVGSGMRFLSEVVVARFLSISEFGVFGLCMTVVAIAQVLVSGGARAVVQRYAAIYFNQGNFPGLVSLIFRLVAVLAVILPLFILAIFSYSESIAIWAGEELVASQVPFFVWAIPCLAIIYLVGDLFRAIHRVVQFSLFQEVIPGGLFLFGLLMLYIFGQPDLESVVSAYSISLFMAALLGLGSIFYSFRHLKITKPSHVTGNDTSKSMVVFAFNSTVLYALWIFRERITLFIISHEMNSEDVALFFVALRFLLAISLIRSALNSLLSPQIAALHRAGKINELGQYYSIMTRWTVLAVAPVVIGVSFYGGELAGFVFGEEYGPIGPIIMTLFVLQILSLSLGPSSITMQMVGKPQIEIGLLMLSLPIIIFVCKPLIGSFGLIGAAYGLYGVILVFDLIRMLLVKKLVRIVPMTLRNMVGIALITAVWICSYLSIDNPHLSIMKSFLVLSAIVLLVVVSWFFLLEAEEKKWLNRVTCKRS